MRLPHAIGSVAAGAALTALYFLAGRAGLALAFVHQSATAVWAPTGLAIAACLLAGPRIWPAIFAGAFLVNVTTAGSIPASLGIAAGNTLEGLAGAWLTERWAGGRHAFDRPRLIFRFIALAALGATTVSATVGVFTLAATGLAELGAAGPIWLTWWLGDAVGAVVVTPLIVLWRVRPRPRWAPPQAAEAALAVAVAVGLGLALFGRWFPPAAAHYPIGFVCLLPILWVAVRFGPREAVTASFLLSLVALAGTLAGAGPFVRDAPNESLLLLQAFIGTVTAMGLVVGTLVEERRRAEARVRRLVEDLEHRVLARTADLQAANDALRREIADRVKAEDALERSRARLLEAEALAKLGQLKNEFLAMVSHELRAPLTAILGWSRLLLRGLPDEESRRRALTTIERNARAQARLIDDLLDVSSMTLGRLTLERRPIDPTAAVAAAVDMMQPTADLKRVRLAVTVGTPPVSLDADPNRFEQIVVNLVSNAVKFTPEGGRVDLHVDGGSDELVLRVRDTGVGIAPELLPFVFDRFRQGDRSVQPSRGGLGLGLAIAHSLVEAHGGAIRAESDGGGLGATFTVTLPARAGPAALQTPPLGPTTAVEP